MDETKAIPRARSRFFYGYWILAVAFVCLFVMSGCGFYSLGLFVKPLQDEFGWSRGNIMLGSLIMTLVQGGGSVVTGKLLDRYGPKIVIVVGAFLAGASLMLLSLMNQPWHYYVLYGLAGGGFAALGFIPATALVFNWFRKKRGTAIGIIGIGVGVGGFVISQAAGLFLIPAFGWRVAWLILGIFSIVAIVPMTLALVKTRPEDIGLQPDGDTASAADAAAARASAMTGLTLGQAVRTPSFWFLAVSCTCFGFAIMAIIQNQVAHLTDIGFTMEVASSAVGAVTIGSAIGKFGFGYVCDWIKPKLALTIGYVLQIAALIILMTVNASSSVPVLWVYAFLIGLGLGSQLPTLSILVHTNFGLLAYGTIYGMINFINQGGGAAGPYFAGAIYDSTGGYQPAFITFLALYVVAIIVTMLIRRPKEMEGIEQTKGHGH